MNKIDHNDPLSKSADIVSENIQQLQQLFPEVFKEGKIDWQELQATLGEHIDIENERFNFTWNGKSNARKEAQKPSTGTLRPAPEESVDWDTTQNLYIEGDNLEVLKLLQKSYHQKVKMIYIDPPYNTGNDFVYKDNYKDNLSNYLELTGQTDDEGKKLSTNSDASGRYHSNWLNMMYPRLKLARNLLKDDGVIFISIDDNELDNLKKLCNEIFGEENYISAISVINNFKGRSDDKYIATANEFLLMYQKGNFNTNGVPIPEEYIKEYKLEENGRKYRHIGLRKRGSNSRRQDRPNMYYPIFYNEKNNDIKFEKSTEDYVEILPKLSDGSDGCWRWGKDTAINRINELEVKLITTRNEYDVFQKDYLYNNEGIIKSVKPKSFWLGPEFSTEAGTIEYKKLFNSKAFQNPKPLGTILNCIYQSISEKNEIVLDFFSGSSTTAHAVMNINLEDGFERKFIMIQLPEPTDEKSEAYKLGFKKLTDIGKERIRRVGNKIKEEYPEKANNLDLGFKVFKLDSSNIKAWSPETENLEQNLLDAVENIKEGRSENDLLFEILLKYGLDLTLPITEHDVAGAKVFNVGAGALLVCLSDDITVAVAEGIAELKNKLNPEICRVVFKDNGFKDSAQKTNVMQKLKQHNIEEVRSI